MIFVLAIIVFLTISCESGRKFQCFQEKNKNWAKLENYIKVRKHLNDSFQTWINNNIKAVLYYKNTPWKIDESVFFNNDQNAAVLLVLQQDTIKQAKMDFIELVFAKKEVNSWNFYYQGMPSLSAERYYTGKKDPSIPYTFEELSNLGKRKLIEGGYLKKCGCKINDEWVNAWYSETLEGMHRDFLNNK